jgi:hypothetical protein
MNDQSRCHDQDLGKRLRQGSLSHALHFCSKKGRAISPGTALGQKRTLRNVAPMSALPPTATSMMARADIQAAIGYD